MFFNAIDIFYSIIKLVIVGSKSKSAFSSSIPSCFTRSNICSSVLS